MHKSNTKREVHSSKFLPTLKKFQINKLTLHFKELKKEQTKPQTEKKEGNNKYCRNT